PTSTVHDRKYTYACCKCTAWQYDLHSLRLNIIQRYSGKMLNDYRASQRHFSREPTDGQTTRTPIQRLQHDGAEPQLGWPVVAPAGYIDQLQLAGLLSRLRQDGGARAARRRLPGRRLRGL